MIHYLNAIAKTNKKDRLKAIIDVLEEHHIAYQIHPINYPSSLGNLVVKMGSHEGKKKVYSAHYDNKDHTPGANDNAAACSILLNLILEASQKEIKQNLEFVFFDLEEEGLLGSHAYMLQNKEQIASVCNLDMCGMGDDILFSSYLGAKELFSFPQNEGNEVASLPPGDANTFISADIPTLFVAATTNHDLPWYQAFAKGKHPTFYPDFARTMHHFNDTPETCNLKVIEKIFSALLHGIH